MVSGTDNIRSDGLREVSLRETMGFSPKQLEAIDVIDRHRFVFYGGAKGGGKSYLLRWFAVRFLTRVFKKYGIKHCRVMIACSTYKELDDRQLSKVRFEFPEWLGKYNEKYKEYRINPQYGGGVICFRNLDDPEQYHSSEFGAVLIDEITLIPEYISVDLPMFQVLRSLLRWPGLPTHECKFVCTGNPQGVGLGWVKRIWIDRMITTGDDPDLFAFVQAFAKDNPHLDSQYVKDLENLPENLKKAWVEGNWNVFRGQFFDGYRNEVHCCAPFPIPRQWRRWRSMDWGSTNPASVGWWAMSPVGHVYRYKELYGPGRTPEEFVKRILGMTDPDENIICNIADPAIFKTKDWKDNQTTLAQEFARLGFPCIPGNNARKLGWMRYQQWLKIYDVPYIDPVTGVHLLRKESRFHVFENCYDYRRTVVNMLHDPDDSGDMLSEGVEDHAHDESRYFFMHLPLEAATVGMSYKVIERPETPAQLDRWRAENGFMLKQDEKPAGRSVGY